MPSVPWVQGILWKTGATPGTFLGPYAGADNLYTTLKTSAAKHLSKLAAGSREVTSTTMVDGFEKYTMGEYEWMTYGDYFQTVENLGSGIAKTIPALKSGETIVIYAETQRAWMIAAYAAWRQVPAERPPSPPPPPPSLNPLLTLAHPCPQRSDVRRPLATRPAAEPPAPRLQGFVVGTIYATLGDEGALFGLNQSKCKAVFADSKLLKVLAKIAGKLTTVKGAPPPVVGMSTAPPLAMNDPPPPPPPRRPRA